MRNCDDSLFSLLLAIWLWRVEVAIQRMTSRHVRRRESSKLARLLDRQAWLAQWLYRRRFYLK